MFYYSRCALVVFTPAYPELERFAERCFLPRHPLRHSPIWLDENDFHFNLKSFERLQIRSPLQIDHHAHDRYRSPYRDTVPSTPVRAEAAANGAPPKATEAQGDGPVTRQPLRTSFSRSYYNASARVVTPICAMRIEYPLLLLNADQVVLSDRGYGSGAAHLRMHAARLMHITGALASYGSDREPRETSEPPVEIDLDSALLGGYSSGSAWDRAAFASTVSPGVSEYFPQVTTGMMNAVTGRPFGSDINSALLAIKERERYTSPWWATLVQWKSIGAVPDKRNVAIHRLSYTKMTKLVHISLIRNAFDVLQHSYINSHTRLFRCLTPPEIIAFDEYKELLEGGHDAQRYLSALGKKMYFPVSIQKDMLERYLHLQNGVFTLTSKGKAEEKEAQQKMAGDEKTTTRESKRKRKRKSLESDGAADSSDSSSPAASEPSSPQPQCPAISTAVYPKDMVQLFFPLYVSGVSIQRQGLLLREDATPVVIEPPLIPDAIEVLEPSAAPPHAVRSSPSIYRSHGSSSSSVSQNTAQTELRYLYHISTLSAPSGEALEPPVHIRSTLLSASPLQPMHGLTGQSLPYVELELSALQENKSQMNVVGLLRLSDPSLPPDETFKAEQTTAAHSWATAAAVQQPLVRRSVWFFAEDVLALGGVVDVNASPVEVHPYSPQNQQRADETEAVGMSEMSEEREKCNGHSSNPLGSNGLSSTGEAATTIATTSVTNSLAGSTSRVQSGDDHDPHLVEERPRVQVWPSTSLGSNEWDSPPALYHVSSLMDVDGFLSRR